MKFFINLCCIAHLFSVTSARLRLTTPLPSAIRLNDDAARHKSNIAEIIEFVNSVNNNDGRNIARRGRYDKMFRRYEVKGINIPPSVVEQNTQDTQNQLENLVDTVRYQVIDNPEVLEEYSNKQKQKNNEELLKPSVESNNTAMVHYDSSAEAKSFGTADKKLIYYHSKSNATASYKTNNNNKHEFVYTPHPNPPDRFQELTTIESTYRPSFPDDDDDIQVSVTEKEISSPRTHEQNHDDPKITNTVEIEKRKMDNKASGKVDQAGNEEKKAPKDDTKEIGEMKHELPIKKDNNNDDEGVIVGVTVNEEKSGNNKEYISSKLDYNNNERPSENKVRSRDEDDKNDGNKNINVTTDTNSENDNKTKGRSLETNNVISVPVERLIGNFFKSALRNKQGNNNYDYMEHSIYAPNERNGNSNKQFENRHEKRNEYDVKKKDKKKYNNREIDSNNRDIDSNKRDIDSNKRDNNWNKRDTEWIKQDSETYKDDRNKKEKNWNKIDKQRYKEDNGYDRMEYEWNNRHLQYDENDNLDKNGNLWDKNDDFVSRDRDSNKRDNYWDNRENFWKKRGTDRKNRDFDANKREDGWNNRDIVSNTRDNDWNERDIDSNNRDIGSNNRDIDLNKRDNNWNNRDIDSNNREIDSNKRDKDWNNRDIDSNKRDIDWNKRDNNWNKRDTEWIKQDSETYKDDRNKNDVDRKQNEWESKYLQHTTVENGGDRYEIIEGSVQNGDKRHYAI